MMKRLFTVTLTLIILTVTCCSEKESTPADTTPVSFSIVPIPVNAITYEGVVQLPSQLIITASGDAAQPVASLLKEFLQSRSIDADIQTENDDAFIVVSIINDASL